MKSSSTGNNHRFGRLPDSSRLRKFLFAAMIVSTIAITTGCRTRNASYRRETALLRAEILDLEDQLYALKARMNVVPASADMPLDTYYAPAIDGVFAGGAVEMGDCCTPADVIYDTPVYPADIFVDGEVLEGTIIDGQPVYGNAPFSGEPVPRNIGPLVEPEQIEGRPIGPAPRPQQLDPPADPQEQTRIPDWDRTDESPDYVEDFNQDVFLDPVESARRTPAYQRPVARNYEQNPVDVSFQRSSPPAAAGRNENVAAIYVDPQVTRGANLDGIRGDEGLELLIQPQNAQGMVVTQPGRMTVSLIDPAAAPISQRLGMWEFSSDEIDLFAVESPGDGRGYLLHLPWELNTPTNNRLVVFVRYITADGRRLETSHEMTIAPPATGYSPRDPSVEAWSRRDSRWNGGSQQSADDLVAERENEEQWNRQGGRVPARPASRKVRPVFPPVVPVAVPDSDSVRRHRAKARATRSH